LKYEIKKIDIFSKKKTIKEKKITIKIIRIKLVENNLKDEIKKKI